MVYIHIRLNVEDYDKWRAGFDSRDDFRRERGHTGNFQIFRDLQNPNTVTEILEWENVEKAQAFLNDPMLQRAMQSLGVIGAPLVRTILQAT
jgi:quinol monooxygenase YgiN